MKISNCVSIAKMILFKITKTGIGDKFKKLKAKYIVGKYLFFNTISIKYKATKISWDYMGQGKG